MTIVSDMTTTNNLFSRQFICIIIPKRIRFVAPLNETKHYQMMVILSSKSPRCAWYVVRFYYHYVAVLMGKQPILKFFIFFFTANRPFSYNRYRRIRVCIYNLIVFPPYFGLASSIYKVSLNQLKLTTCLI